MTEGHDEQAGKDPFELSDEEYQKERDRLLQEPTVESEEPATKGETDASSDTGDKGQTEKTVEAKPFTLAEPEPKVEPETPRDEVQTFDIVHRGQVHKVTKDKLVELAQKGFDYDFKVGPHGKLVQLIDSDRGAADVLNDYIRTKYSNAPVEPPKPQLKPMSEYDDERKWLEDNVKVLAANQPRAVQAPARPDPVSVMHAAIQTHDPTGSAEIIPILAEEAMNLSLRDSRTIEEAAARGDLSKFFQFYDHVKANVRPAPIVPPKQTFKMKSGGGEPHRTTDKQINAWDMPAKDFQAMLAKVKSGYS